MLISKDSRSDGMCLVTSKGTRVLQQGITRTRLPPGFLLSRQVYGILPEPVRLGPFSMLRGIVETFFSTQSQSLASRVIIHGKQGIGKSTVIKSVADAVGVNVYEVPPFRMCICIGTVLKQTGQYVRVDERFSCKISDMACTSSGEGHSYGTMHSHFGPFRYLFKQIRSTRSEPDKYGF